MTDPPGTTSVSNPPPLHYARAKFLLQGDSLTQLGFEGWAAHLANVYQRRADILARGYGGYNTRMYLQLPIEDDLNNIALGILLFGANDSGLAQYAAHHHVPVEEYRKNLQKLYDRLQKDYQCTRILFIGPPPVHHAQRLAYQKQRYGDKATGILERTLEHTKLYADACAQVAHDNHAPFLNLYQAMMEADPKDWGRFFTDGLHFSSQGHDFVGQAVIEAIQTGFPELTVTADPRTGQWCNSASSCAALPNHGGPFHDEIDNEHVAAAFDKWNAALVKQQQQDEGTKKRKRPE